MWTRCTLEIVSHHEHNSLWRVIIKPLHLRYDHCHTVPSFSLRQFRELLEGMMLKVDCEIFHVWVIQKEVSLFVFFIRFVKTVVEISQDMCVWHIHELIWFELLLQLVTNQHRVTLDDLWLCVPDFDDLSWLILLIDDRHSLRVKNSHLVFDVLRVVSDTGIPVLKSLILSNSWHENQLLHSF